MDKTRRISKLFLIATPLLIIAILALVIYPYGRNLPVFSRELSTLVTITHPSNGAILPLHGTFEVRGEATSREGVGELQLIVNGQPWGSKTFDVHLPAVQSSWQWTPSAEGVHELFVRVIDGSGRVAESNHIRVIATPKADVRFPLQYSTVEGDTVDSLAQQAGIGPQEITDANPGLDPNASLPPGSSLIIPMHVPNAPPSQPESGAPPAPPVEPLPDAKNDPSVIVQTGVKLIQGDANKNSSGFLFVNGKVVPAKKVDQLYLYVSLNHMAPWQRIPDQSMTFLSPQAGGFDISAYLDLAKLEASPTPVSIDMEAWGWQGGSLIFVGTYHGMLGGGLRIWPPKDTELKIVAYETLNIPKYVQDISLAGEDPTLTVDLDWTTSAPDASYGRWQVSTEPFSDDLNLFPNGLVQEGVVQKSQNRFTVDFKQYFSQSGSSFWGDIFDPVGDFFNSLNGEKKPLKTFWKGAPLTFYIRIIPLKGGSPFSVQPTGTSSNTVTVHYLPSGEALAETAEPGGPVYETHIVEFVPYRAADPKYKACTVLTKDLKFGFGNTMPAGTQSCGCPGVSCSGGGSSCSLDDPGSWFTDCPADAVNAIGKGLNALYDFASNLYNDAKEFVVNALSAGLCNENFLGAVMSEGTCKTLVNIGVNAGLAAMGLPPEIPNFEQLFNEGLEYAVASLASQITGFECDATCRDLLKKAYQGVSDPKQLYEEGLQYGASLAASELNDLGVDCDAKCESLIKEGAQGNLTASKLTDEALNKLTEDTAQKLNDQGYPCDDKCKEAIHDSLKKGNGLGQAVASTASTPPPQPTWVPHPLAVEQPAIAKVEVFRRFESAQLDPAIIADRCSGFSLTSSATNNMYSMTLTGEPFEPRAVEVPYLEPGGSFLIPVVLHPAPWFLPQGFHDPIDPFLLGYQDVGTENGEPIGQVQQGLGSGTATPFDSQWRVLYFGSQIELKTFGPFMLDVIDGQSMSFPCFSEDTQQYSVPPHSQ